jgi:hypothetical protein
MSLNGDQFVESEGYLRIGNTMQLFRKTPIKTEYWIINLMGPSSVDYMHEFTSQTEELVAHIIIVIIINLLAPKFYI